MIQIYVNELETRLKKIGDGFYQIIEYNKLIDCDPKSTLTKDEINSLDSLFKIFKVASTKNETLNEKEYLLMLWVTLGSLTECIMQLFLKVFYSDYERDVTDKLKELDSINSDKLKEDILEVIGNYYKDAPTTSKKNIKTQLKSIINKKFQEPKIENLTLGILNNFYKEYIWTSEDIQNYYSTIDFIRKNRNCIHSTKVAEVDNKKSLEKVLKGYIKIIDDMYIRTPEVSWEVFD